MAKKFREAYKTFENVFDNFTIRNLFELSSRGHFDENTMSPISIGKEANVFSAKKDGKFIVIKIYRLETCDFNKMYEYIKPDPRYQNLAKKRRDIIFAWAQREYRNLLMARTALLKTPLPITFMKNILVLEFIGDEHPAPMVKDQIPKNPKKFLNV